MSSHIKIVLRKKIRKDGLYPICLRITKSKKTKFISLNINCKIDEFENEKFKRGVANYKKKNLLLLKIKTKAIEIVDELLIKKSNFSLEEFEDVFRGNKNQKAIYLLDFFDTIHEELIKVGNLSNAKVYKETKNSLIKFKGDKITFEKVTNEFLEQYEIFLKSNGNTNGGVAFKMRIIRAIFNKARKRKVIPNELYPFNIYKVSKLKSNPDKRALSIEEFKKFRDVDLSAYPHLQEAYNYFMFSVYCRGVNFHDMMHLKWSNIRNGRIYYTRSKTKVNLNLEITKSAQ